MKINKLKMASKDNKIIPDNSPSNTRISSEIAVTNGQNLIFQDIVIEEAPPVD